MFSCAPKFPLLVSSVKEAIPRVTGIIKGTIPVLYCIVSQPRYGMIQSSFALSRYLFTPGTFALTAKIFQHFFLICPQFKYLY